MTNHLEYLSKQYIYRLSYIQNQSIFFQHCSVDLSFLVEILIGPKGLWESALVGLKIYQRIFIERLLCNVSPYEHLAKFFLRCCLIRMCYRKGWWEQIKLRNLLFLFYPPCSPQSSVLMTSRVWPCGLVERKKRSNPQGRDISRNVKRWGRRK